MHSGPVRLTVAVALALVGLRWIVNTNPWSGPTVLQLADGHGVHLHDWVSLVCWAAAALLVWPRLAALRPPPPATTRSTMHSTMHSTTHSSTHSTTHADDRLRSSR